VLARFRDRRAEKRADADAAAGFAALKRFQSDRDPGHLDTALHGFDAWVDWSENNYVPRQRRAAVDGARATALVSRADAREDLLDAEAGLIAVSRALDSGCFDDVEGQRHCKRAQVFGIWVRARIEADAHGFDAAILLCEQSPQPLLCTHETCRLLIGRYRLTGNQADLNRARSLWDSHESDRIARGDVRTADDESIDAEFSAVT